MIIMPTKFIKEKTVKELFNKNGKQITKEAVKEIDNLVEKILGEILVRHNTISGRITDDDILYGHDDFTQ